MSFQTNDATTNKLSTVAIFAKLEPFKIAQIEKRCAWQNFQAGTTIIDYLDKSDDVYFIATGEARVIIYSIEGKAVTFCDLGPGEMLGEYAAIDSSPRSTTIEARSACLIASMAAQTFRELLQAEPTIAMELLRQLVSKVRVLTNRVYEFSALAVNNRIQAELLRLAKLSECTGKTATIEPAPIHSDIASRTSTHREAVAREMSRLTKIGLLKRKGKALIVNDMADLAAMVHEATGE